VADNASKSAKNKNGTGAATGKLYVVATPIGNLEDITLRALRVLKEVDVIACEDTRRTIRLLNHFEIRKPLVSYHDHNERTRAAELVAKIKSGQRMALVTDAGTPLVSDPGHDLVVLCIENGIPVEPVPGVSAITAALAVAGIPAEEFVFLGFAPARGSARRRFLAPLAGERRTLIFYEAPHRLAAMLTDAHAEMGDRHAVVARELTKIHEEFARGRLSELAARFSQAIPKGEITVLIAPRSPEVAAADMAGGGSIATTLSEKVAQLTREAGLDSKAALKQAARELRIPRREAYMIMLESRRGDR
jgi:16S rRNA (cytidine1402-2'-O)-methyltransferase